MRIAMLGQKGFPAKSGGVEQHVDILSRQLADRGHDVVVYSRPSYCGWGAKSQEIDGVRRIVRPSVPTKHLDTITHTAVGTLDVTLRRADVVHYHCVGPASLAPLARLTGLPIVVTVHSLDWQRSKWGRVARAFLRFGERMAARSAHRLVVVSPVLQEYFAKNFDVEATCVPNAVAPLPHTEPRRILEYGIRPGRYVLAVSRLEPGKGLEDLTAAFTRTQWDGQLVIAGGPGLGVDFEKQLRATADHRTIFTGDADRGLMAELYSNARVFALPSPREGMSIALLEAMSMSLPVVISDIPENTCVAGDIGATYPVGNVDALSRVLNRVLDDMPRLLGMSRDSAERSQRYTWPETVDAIERVYRECAATRRRMPAPERVQNAPPVHEPVAAASER